MSPMKILHLTTHLNTGGITQYLLTLGKGLVSRGHQVWVLSSGGERVPDFEREKINCKILPIRAKCEFHPKLWLQWGTIRKWILQEKFDLVHAHTRVTQVMASLLSKWTGLASVTSCHGFFRRNPGRILFPCWGQAVIAISPMVADHLRQFHRVDAQRIKMIYNAIEVESLRQRFNRQEREAIRRKYHLSQEALVFGSMSRLVPEKGQEDLIRAFPRVRQKHSNTFLLIAGEGRTLDSLKELARQLRVDSFIRWIGNLPDTSEPLAAMDFFVLPVTGREGFGLAMVEAMALGKPVISTENWGLAPLIQQKKAGYLVPSKEPEALASQMIQVIDEEQTRQEVIQNGRRLVEELFTPSRQVQQVEQLYQELIAKP